MLNYYILFSLVGFFISAQSNQAFCTQILHPLEKHDDSTQQEERGSHSLLAINFNAFGSNDPYELEDQHQAFFKSGQFNEASIALIASAINGNSDNLDYLLKLDPQAFEYIHTKNMEKTRNLILKIAEDLEKQHARSLLASVSIRLPDVKELTSEVLSSQK